MNGSPGRLSAVAFVSTGLAFLIALGGGAQAPAQPASTAKSNSQEEMNAEREKIWNSADMLRARAWLQDYCSKSVKVTPEMAKQYQAELANMTPNQLKLWLLKFDEQEEQRQQQYAMFQQANSAGLQQAMAAHRQTQQAYSALNQAQSQSAQGAQRQINEQRDAAQSAQENKQLYQSAPYQYPDTPYGSYGGYGGIHYHYHLY